LLVIAQSIITRHSANKMVDGTYEFHDCVEINREMGIMREKRASLIGPRVSNGVPRLNRSPWNAATVAHRRRPIYYPARAHCMDFS